MRVKTVIVDQFAALTRPVRARLAQVDRAELGSNYASTEAHAAPAAALFDAP